MLGKDLDKARTWIVGERSSLRHALKPTPKNLWLPSAKRRRSLDILTKLRSPPREGPREFQAFGKAALDRSLDPASQLASGK